MSDIELTQEMKDRLKKIGCLGFELEEEWKYVPRSYREKDKKGKFKIPQKLWPVFTLRGLDGIETTEMEDLLNGGIEYVDGKTIARQNLGLAKTETCKRGIVTWSNFRNSKFEIIKPPEKNPAGIGIIEDSLRYISPSLMVELTNAITEHMHLTDEELLGLG